MKVAIVYHSFPHYREAVLRELLNSPRHDYLLVADEQPADQSIKPWPVADRSRFVPARCHRLFGAFLFQSGLMKLGLRRDLDAVIYLGNPYLVSTWLSALLARLSGKRVLFWTHGWTRDERGPKARFRILFYWLSHGLLLHGHFAKMAGIKRGFPPERLHVIYNSLDYEKQKRLRDAIRPEETVALRRSLFPRADLPVVMCSARLTDSCQLELLLQAQAILRQQGHEFNVLLIGEGPARSALERMAHELQLSVHFHGACYDESTLARLTATAWLTVSPGKIGLTAMQSLAYGVPVVTHDDVATQMPEWEAIQCGLTGQLFRPGDAADLARTIRTWTQKPPDPATRAACYSIIERFYNARFQRRAIERALEGRPADDLFWLKEPEACAVPPQLPGQSRFPSAVAGEEPAREFSKQP